MRRAIALIVGYLALSAIIVASWFVAPFTRPPKWPESPIEWGIAALVFLLAFPATVVLEGIGTWLHNNRATRAVEERTKGKQLSVLRIIYNLAYGLLVIAIVVGLVFAWRQIGPK